MYEIIQEDKELFVYLNTLGSQPFDQFWILVSEKFIWIPLYIIFLYLIYKNYKWKNLVYIMIFVALGVTISDQLAGIFKDGIARLRPCHDPSLDHLMRDLGCGGQFGFYSAHASSTFFVASFLTFILKRYYKYLPVFLFAWASMVAYSRIYLGAHFPMDVIFGAAVGFLLGGFFSTLAFKVIYRRKKSENQ